MEGARECQLPIVAARALWQLHTAKHLMRLFHVSLRSARRYLAKGFVPARIAAWALPIMDAEVLKREARLEAIHRDIERAEVALGLRPCGVPAGGGLGAQGGAAISAAAREKG